MTDPYLAEVRMFGGNFAPTGWAFCSGQLMPIAQNQPLFSLLGTTYGGDGSSTFALPDLRGRAPMQQGMGRGLSQRPLGDVGGAQTVSLLESELAPHTHTAQSVDAPGSSNSPADAVFAQGRSGRGADRIYSTAEPNLMLNPAASGSTGSGEPHNNMPPYLCVSFIIALQGIFPQP